VSDIYLLWPTIRPTIMVETFNNWRALASKDNNIHLEVAVNTTKQAQTVQKLLDGFGRVINIDNKKIGVTRAATVLSRGVNCKSPNDIVILASDDMYPFKNWDRWIVKQLKKKTGCLIVKDGHNDGGVVTIPIMTYSCLRRLNHIIYHPDYDHLYSDAELMDNLKALNLDINVRDKAPSFEHRHWACNKREKDAFDHKFVESMDKDAKTYNRRKILPVKQRLQLSVKQK